MKRYVLLLLLILSLALLTSVESDPSATVGYFKKSVASDGWEAFSLPFYYTSLSPDQVLGTQFGDLDTVSDMATGENSFYITGAGWLGSIVEMAYGHAYWIYRDMSNSALDYYLLGEVNPQPVTIHVSGDDEGNWSPFSLNEARQIDINTLPVTGVVDIDTIVDISTGENSFYITGVGWLGSLFYIDPTHAYWYNSLSPTSFNWTYTPAARNLNVNPPAASRSLPVRSK
jgi:hypothetical protein